MDRTASVFVLWFSRLIITTVCQAWVSGLYQDDLPLLKRSRITLMHSMSSFFVIGALRQLNCMPLCCLPTVSVSPTYLHALGGALYRVGVHQPLAEVNGMKPHKRDEQRASLPRKA